MEDLTPQRARNYFSSGGFYWAESVILAVAESQDIQSDILPKIATGFCSGLSRTGGLCGALSGAIMGLGLLQGRNIPNSSVDRNYLSVQDLLTQFETHFGSTLCQSLTGVDLITPEGREEFANKNQIESCLNYVEFTTQFVMDLHNKLVDS